MAHTNDASLPPRLKAEILRQVERLEPAMQQLAAVEAERDAMLEAQRAADAATSHAVTKAGGDPDTPTPTLPDQEGARTRLLRLKGIGPETAAVLAGEAFFRDFYNRREIASSASLTPKSVAERWHR